MNIMSKNGKNKAIVEVIRSKVEVNMGGGF